ncbi:transposase [Nocardioides sp. TRM66260-LWL]|uniref:sigma factor-like helix-turn-helix DNA-binding protein n=1 Tax=Nocardioides sp. TRM66260-LWL TaxID=2874478 RepID=UPI001CC5B764|nr:sigma factor-like helix-turn-helix DNA-binding protein [Nocardioides sp. TRM66260-LWL]MBZ5734350.1 transposase [Nocardioides sp. TRM66260-LWL]
MLAVLTLDQRGSRVGPDRVPALLERIASLPVAARFARTAGDEVQGVLDSPDALVDLLGGLLRSAQWNVGIGLGEVEQPLPVEAPAGRGEAYLAARAAVTAAKSSPWRLRVVGEPPEARSLETTLWLWAAVLHRRTERGWEVADLAAAGSTYAEIGERLGISQSAVSQRAQAAGIVEERRARELAGWLAARVLTPADPADPGAQGAPS